MDACMYIVQHPYHIHKQLSARGKARSQQLAGFSVCSPTPIKWALPHPPRTKPNKIRKRRQREERERERKRETNEKDKKPQSEAKP